MDEIGWLFKALRGILHEKPTITTRVVESFRCFSKGNTWHLVWAYKLGFVKEVQIRRLCTKKFTTEVKMDGAYSWVICAVCCIANAATCGFYNSYGTLFVAIIQEYQVSETVAGEEIFLLFFLSWIIDEGKRAVAVVDLNHVIFWWKVCCFVSQSWTVSCGISQSNPLAVSTWSHVVVYARPTFAFNMPHFMQLKTNSLILFLQHFATSYYWRDLIL